MELKAKDIYRVDCADCLSMDLLTSLVSLYQPLISRDAVCLYLTLLCEGQNQKSAESHQRLGLILNLSMDDIERARVHLEEFLLLRCYVKEDGPRSSYLYVLNPPLSVKSFLSSTQLMDFLNRTLGEKTAAQTCARLETGRLSSEGYHEITRQVSYHTGKGRAFNTEVVYSHIEPRYDFAADDTAINFDYETFIATTTALVFPAELRTQENLKLIGKLATIYGLSPERMRILVSRCVNIAAMTFDADRLKALAAAEKHPDVTQAKDVYSLPPVSFLQARQNGAAVSLSDKKLLERLSMDMHFPPEVINVMIEYILRVSQNRLIPTFVDMVAGEWSRDGVRTKEDAIAEAKKKISQAPRHHDELPAYYDTLQEKIKNRRPATKSEQEEIQAMLKGMSGNGKG